MRAFPLFIIAFLPLLAGCGASSSMLPNWESTGGPHGQNVSALLADARNPYHLFAGLTTGELYESMDSGSAWTKISVLVPRSPIRFILQDPDSMSVLLVASDAGLVVSTDRGRLWSPAGPTREGRQLPCRTLAIDPWSPATRYAGTIGGGIFKSTDRGATWNAANATDTLLSVAEVNDVKIAPSRPDLVFAAVSGMGILRSSDGGGSWERLTPQFTPLTPAATHVLVHRKDDARVLYATDIGTIGRSSDRGDHWTIMKQEDEASRVLSLTADPQDPDLIYAGAENGLLVSTNFGSSWSQPLSTLPSIPISVAAVPGHPKPRLYIFGPGLGLQASGDGGGTWEHADRSLGGAAVSFVTTDPRGEKVFAAVGVALLRLEPLSGSWIPASSGLTGGDVTSLAFDVDSSNVIFATTTGGAFKSSDNGAHWKPIARNVRMSARLIDTHPTIHTRMLASGPLGIFVSTDKGNSWSQAKPQGNKFTLEALTFTPTNAGIIHAATKSLGVLLSKDGGIRWEQSRYGLTSDNIMAITMDGESPRTYYAWTPGGECFASINKGLEWNRFNPPWKAGDIVKLAHDRLQPYSVVSLVNGQDIYYSRTGGRSWLQIRSGNPRLDVNQTHWNARTETLYVGTADQGIYRLNLGPLIEEYATE
jgi:photosystem II stability/assembly factor-like uncharacterized protein